MKGKITGKLAPLLASLLASLLVAAILKALPAAALSPFGVMQTYAADEMKYEILIFRNSEYEWGSADAVIRFSDMPSAYRQMLPGGSMFYIYLPENASLMFIGSTGYLKDDRGYATDTKLSVGTVYTKASFGAVISTEYSDWLGDRQVFKIIFGEPDPDDVFAPPRNKDYLKLNVKEISITVPETAPEQDSDGSTTPETTSESGAPSAADSGAGYADPIDSASDWAREAIGNATANGYVPGDIQNYYGNNITRAEFCRIAVKYMEFALGKDVDAIMAEKGVSRNPKAFTDTGDPDILAAYAVGITSGTGNNEFSPDAMFTREQAATMIMNTCSAMGADVNFPPSSGFADMDDASAWAVNGIDFCFANGIMKGTGDNNFSPLALYTREQSIVTFDNIKPSELPKLTMPSVPPQAGELQDGPYTMVRKYDPNWERVNKQVVYDSAAAAVYIDDMPVIITNASILSVIQNMTWNSSTGDTFNVTNGKLSSISPQDISGIPDENKPDPGVTVTLAPSDCAGDLYASCVASRVLILKGSVSALRIPEWSRDNVDVGGLSGTINYT